ncbi:hypothetical protein SCA6_011276, partial [Theobroma cacao]
VDLLKNEEAHAIIGPQWSAEARFAIELGEMAHVPVVSFSATSPPLSPTQNTYFIRTAQNDASQIKAIVAILKQFGWPQVVLIHEDTEYGNVIVPYLFDSLQENDIRLTDKAGMMTEGYSWLITDGISNSVEDLDPADIKKMEGVLGVKAHVLDTNVVKNFKMRWQRNMRLLKPNSSLGALNIFGFWAYDTVWALATAAERIGPTFLKGFTEFVKIEKHGTNETLCKGFSIDVFEAALKKLDFNVSYDYVPFMNDEGKSNGSYNDLLHQIEHKIVDAVVGDTTIIADRTSYVDFTLPYSESGIVMVVPIKHEKSKTLWSFSYPVSWDLWLAIILSCIFFGLVIRIMDRHHTANTGFGGPPRRQLGMILWFPFSSLVFPQQELLLNGYSRFVLVMWLFLAFILMQSYTASLSSILTVDQLHPTSVSVQKLKEKGYNVGYQNSSFVLDFLKNQLKFDESKLKPYDTVADYHKALSKGSEHNGVAAIFDGIPYIRLFLAKHGSEYMMTGPMYRTDGFGFAFPRGSALVSYSSRAILKVREDTIMDNIAKKHFKHQITSLYPVAPISASSPSLCVRSFGGLFIITGIATLLALVFSEGYFSEKLVSMAKNYGRRYLSSRAPNIVIELVAHSITMVDDCAHSPNEIQNSGDSSEVFNHNEGSVHQEDAVT